MEDQKVEFDTARLAHEKGFWKHNESCETGFNPDTKKEITGGLWDQVCNEPRSMGRPTQTMLQRWLREEHKIHVNCLYVTGIGMIEEYGRGMYFWGIIECPELDGMVKLFETYEGAKEVGLFEALKQIK